MNVNVLIDAIVKQTMILVAQLATAAGVRAPLAQTRVSAGRLVRRASRSVVGRRSRRTEIKRDGAMDGRHCEQRVPPSTRRLG
jgi:hypothetical protein